MNSATEQSFIETFGEPENESVASESLDLAIQDYFLQGELSPKVIATMQSAAAKGLEAVFSYCLAGRPLDEKGLQLAARRFVSVAWLLHSDFLLDADGKSMTLDRLSNLPQLDCTKCALSILAQNFGKQFNYHARVQKRAGSKSNYAKSATAGWAKRNLPTKVCVTCKSDRPRADFVKGSAKCRSCRARAAELQAKKEAARAEKLPPHCKVCETYDISKLITRKNPSGSIGFRNICWPCYYEGVAELKRKRKAKALETPIGAPD